MPSRDWKLALERFAIEFEGESARLAEILKDLYAKQLEAVKFVAEKRTEDGAKDTAYHDLMARRRPATRG